MVSRICFFDLWFSALAKRDHRFMPLLFLYAPPFIIAKRRLQSGLFCISADLSYNSRELTKITGTCLLQIRDFSKSPLFILLL